MARLFPTLLCASLLPVLTAAAADASIESIQIHSNKVNVWVSPDDASDIIRILTSSNLVTWQTNTTSTAPGTNNALQGNFWTTNAPTSGAFFVRAEIVPASSERQLAAHVLNRLAYGHTPYELGRILGFKTNNAGTTNWWVEFGNGIADGGIGVDAWINEQLNPAAITEDVTNQFSLNNNGPLNQSLATIANRFGDIDTVVLTNKAHTNVFFVTNGMDVTTNYVTNINHEITQPGTVSFHDFRAWYAMHAIGARRQLLEVMLYWLENHFVSQWTKARETFQGQFNQVGGDIQNRIPTKMEVEEHKAYRAAMLNPNITFKELLYLQHKSLSMTVYLDTDDSRADGNNIANENYAREIQELYGMGVDNGYDQGDIIAMSIAWTGWGVSKVAPANAFNVLAPALPGPNSNNFGVYIQTFNRNRHGNGKPMYIWYERDSSVAATGTNYPNGKVLGPKYIPQRFNGSGMTPSYNYADKDYGNGANGNYSLFIPSTVNSTNLANIAAMTNKAYTVMSRLADLPFTQEYISVKLCQLLVHDDFHHGYDFSDGAVTPEEQLVWNCMMTWKDTGGQIYEVIRTITESALFRSHAAYRQKIKTPLEFTISAVRALRMATNDNFTAGNFSANSDGYSIVAGNSSTASAYPLNRMGLFLIFNRAEPDGYPETGTVYVGANGLVERVRWIHSILPNTPTADGIAGGNRTRTDPYGLILRHLGPGLRRDADAVARLFLRLLYPGEGSANIDPYRVLAINLLNTNDTGNFSSFASLTPAATGDYDTRVRRMVAALMSLQRFNEQ